MILGDSVDDADFRFCAAAEVSDSLTQWGGLQLVKAGSGAIGVRHAAASDPGSGN